MNNTWISNDKILYTSAPDKLVTMIANGTDKRVIEGVKAFNSGYNAKKKSIANTHYSDNALMLYDLKTKTNHILFDGNMFIRLFDK